MKFCLFIIYLIGCSFRTEMPGVQFFLSTYLSVNCFLLLTVRCLASLKPFKRTLIVSGCICVGALRNGYCYF